tara:strand:+ start:97 stop:246 length:150 start_codon:yes stop_codon:yes gene_type:complete
MLLLSCASGKIRQKKAQESAKVAVSCKPAHFDFGMIITVPLNRLKGFLE